MAESGTQAEQNQAVEKVSTDNTDKKPTAKKAKKPSKKPATRRRPAKKSKPQNAASRATEEDALQKNEGVAEVSPPPAAVRPDTAKQEEEPNVEAVAESVDAPAAQNNVAEPSEEPEQAQTGDMPGEKPETQPNMQWGRRSKRTGPIVREDQTQRVIRPVVITAPQKVQPQAPPVQAPYPARETPADVESGIPKPDAETPAVKTPEHVQVAKTPEHVQNSAIPEQTQVVETPEQTEDDAEDDLETEAQNDLSDQDSRRSRRRRRGRGRDRRSEDPRNRPEQARSEDQRNRPEQARSEDQRSRPEQVQRKENQVQRSNEDPRNRGRDERAEGRPSRSLADLMAETWTEDKARRFLSEGLLAQLSPRLLGQSEIRIPDAAALREPLRMIRKVLADECMVADDATDVMLLDLVMNALIDRIDVCRLQAKSQAPEDIEVLLDLRYKADRRLIEALNALKNA